MSHNNSYGNFAGVNLNECLPNITGKITASRSNYTIALQGISANGAFYVDGTAQSNSFEWYYQNWDVTSSFSIDASRLYSGKKYRNNCNAVRSYSYGVYIWVRTS